jgi:hypothetical protein
MPAQKYFFDDQADRAIREAYSSPELGRSAIKALERRLGIPRQIVFRRALKLGLTPRHTRQPRWSATEERLLQQHAWKAPDVIARHLRKAGFQRSATAVALHLNRTIGLTRDDARIDAGVYKANEVARLLGVDGRTLMGFIERGELPAQRFDGRSDGRAIYWLVKEKDLRNLLMNYTAHFNFGRIDKYWLVDLLSGRSNLKQPD